MSEKLGERVLLENERIRIWDHPIPAGSMEDCHTHRNPYVAVVVQGGTAEIWNEEGDTTQRFDFEEGQTLYFGADVLPTTHAVTNRSGRDIRMILVELLG